MRTYTSGLFETGQAGADLPRQDAVSEPRAPLGWGHPSPAGFTSPKLGHSVRCRWRWLRFLDPTAATHLPPSLSRICNFAVSASVFSPLIFCSERLRLVLSFDKYSSPSPPESTLLASPAPPPSCPVALSKRPPTPRCLRPPRCYLRFFDGLLAARLCSVGA